MVGGLMAYRISCILSTPNGIFGAGFSMTTHSSLFLGYRYLTIDFQEDDFLADLTAVGLVLGVEFSF